MPKKVETMIPEFQRNPHVGLVFSNGLITDSKLNRLGYSVWDTFRLRERDRNALMGANPLAFLIRHYSITGATMAFRASLKENILSIPKVWIHDAWIACLIACQASIVAIDEPLILYRQHENNVVGGTKLSLLDRFDRVRKTTAAEITLEISRANALLDELKRLGGQLNFAQSLTDLSSKIAHLNARESVFYIGFSGRTRIVIGELFRLRYHRFSKGFASAFTDIFLRRRIAR